MSVAVRTRRRCRGVRAAQVRADAVRLLRALGVAAELSVALVSDADIRRLNAHYRRKDRPTDVLSFEGSAVRPDPRSLPQRGILGDVVISVETAARQAAERDVSVGEEVRFLLAHGVLHLLGYDHETSPAAARRMFAQQRRLIQMLHAASPSRSSRRGSR